MTITPGAFKEKKVSMFVFFSYRHTRVLRDSFRFSENLREFGARPLATHQAHT